MKRRTFIKSIGVIGCLPAVTALSRASATAAPSQGSETLRILTCNIRVDVPDDSRTGDGWAHRRDFCAEVIAARKADLIGFQEVQQIHFDFLREKFAAYATFALYNPGKNPAPSNAIFYRRDRFDLISSGGFWLSETPHIAGSKSWDSANIRFVNWVHLRDRVSGKELRFWNMHLDHISQKARENAAAMIVAAAGPLPVDLPQILTGDMNAGANNPAIKAYRNAGWIDTFTTVHGPKEPGFTAHAFRGESAPATRPDGTPKEKIDWIFCRGGLIPKAASIIKDTRNGHYPSDHYFVSADVTI